MQEKESKEEKQKKRKKNKIRFKVNELFFVQVSSSIHLL